MLRKLIPTYYAKRIFDIDYNQLKQAKITNIFFDLDNTLSAYYTITPDQDLIMFIQSLQHRGFQVFIISNNRKDRVETFVAPLQVPYLSSAKKPGKKRLFQWINQMNLDIKSCVLIGDQLLTDVICANAIGMTSILVEPFVIKDLPITRINRFFDKRIRRYLLKNNKLKSIAKESGYE